MITLPDAQKRVTESLNGFPPEVIQAYLAFAEKRNPEDLDVVILGVLHFYLAKKPKVALTTLPGTTRMAADLGVDSLTMMDTIFMVESLYDVKLDDAMLAKLVTLDDLRNYLRSLAGLSVAN